MKITEHFDSSEFDLPESKAAEYGFHATAYPPALIDTCLRPLCMALEKIRAKLGAPISVISGFRPKEYDLARIAAGRKGVSPNSQHHQGRAADIQVHGISPERVRDTALALWEVGDISIGGLGLYDDFCHVDVRPGPLKTWDERTKK